MRTQIFISYSHKDKRWLDEHLVTLAPHIRAQRLDVWADTRIGPGSLWRDAIRDALSRASVAVLLVSRHFLASDFIANEELPSILEAQEKEGVRILWVAVSDSAFDISPIAKFQAVNNPKRPLDSLSVDKRSKELVQICREVMRASVKVAQLPDVLAPPSHRLTTEVNHSGIGNTIQPSRSDPEISEVDVQMLLEIKERDCRLRLSRLRDSGVKSGIVD